MQRLPDFLRRLADERKAEGDSISELLIESAEYIERLEAKESNEAEKRTGLSVAAKRSAATSP